AALALAVGSACLSMLIVVGHREPAATVRGIPGWFGAIVGVGLATGVLMLSLWRQRREIGELAGRHVALVDDLPIGVYRCGPDGTLVDVNPAMARIFGFATVDALKAAPLDQLLPAEVREASIAEIAASGVAIGEFPYSRPNGDLVWVRYRGTAIRGREGQRGGIEGVVEDATADHPARQVANRLASVVESATDAITSSTL